MDPWSPTPGQGLTKSPVRPLAKGPGFQDNSLGDNYPLDNYPLDNYLPPGKLPQDNSPQDYHPLENYPQTTSSPDNCPCQTPPPPRTIAPRVIFSPGESPNLTRNFFCFCFGTRSLLAFTVRPWVHFQGRVQL